MTEDEAKTTQCCGPEGCGRVNDNPYPARWCVGSACMAWRETVPPVLDYLETKEVGTEEPGAVLKLPAVEGWVRGKGGKDRPSSEGGRPYRWVEFSRLVPGAPGEGYCGLAGQPL